MTAPRDLAAVLAGIADVWSPRTVAEVNGEYDVRVARGAGEFPAHRHPETDELFLVLRGQLTLRLGADVDDTEVSATSVELGPGQLYVVTRGRLHQPVAGPDGVELLLVEPSATVNTGDTPGALTAARRVVSDQPPADDGTAAR